MFATTHWAQVLLVLVFVSAACSASSAPTTASDNATTETSPGTSRTYALGEFPPFPDEPLSESTAEALQAELDEAVQQGTFTGVTAAVIIAGRGNWTGAAGSLDDAPLTPDSQQLTHSAGKTIVAAQVLRLVEDGKLSLDDRASAHLPPELEFFDANGATIRQVLGMRSGIPDLKAKRHFYPAELASSATEVFRKLPEPKVRPGSETNYKTTNYVLLGTIIEHATGRPLAEVLRSDVLDHPGLEGIAYPVEDALAGDGWRVESTPASLARWGYELYGGVVLSDASLGEMIDFQGEGKGYGLGIMDFSSIYGTLAVGHDGGSSVTTCCSSIKLVALPEEGVVISVQANTAGAEATDPYHEVMFMTHALRAALEG